MSHSEALFRLTMGGKTIDMIKREALMRRGGRRTLVSPALAVTARCYPTVEYALDPGTPPADVALRTA
jgi:hypothetical protein